MKRSFNGCDRRLMTLIVTLSQLVGFVTFAQAQSDTPRQRISINEDWRFTRDDPQGSSISLLYDVRPEGRGGRRGAPPPEPQAPTTPPSAVVKAWVLPTGNSFLKDQTSAPKRPEGNPGQGVSYIAPGFNDSSWLSVTLPHDYAIEGPFILTGGGGMGRLPTAGVAWYRKKLNIPAADAGKSIFIDFDGAMSYSEVWLNGQFVGGWPFGYSSFRLDLTPYVKPGGENVLSVRLDNPGASSRWYPGAGIHRNVWLVETNPVHVGQWGTYITTPEVTATTAPVSLKVTLNNDSKSDASVSVITRIFELDGNDQKAGGAVATIASTDLSVRAGSSAVADGKTTIANPNLWGTGANQKPNRYVAVTTVTQSGKTTDTYETPFGVRTLKYDANEGFFLNGQHIKLNGVCNHHDLGALGSAINVRALQRQLEILQEMGCNAIRTSHNPPTPELLDLCDKMGFLVMDEAFDCWANQKTQLDYHLLYQDWHEQDLRAMLRRDRNHPSIIMWSIGNEVGEQNSPAGGAIAKELTAICHEEDPTRPTTSAMNNARPGAAIMEGLDLIGLNYQGAGLNSRNPQYPTNHAASPDKVIYGSETTDAYSTRGYYTFGGPAGGRRGGGAFGGRGPASAPATGPAAAGFPGRGARGGAADDGPHQVSSYDLDHAGWSYIPDYEFAAQDNFKFVAGEFVWTGFDYLGEPDPYSQFARSSYSGIIDLAGFKKDRFYLYQSYWRPNHPMAHILPHWNWSERVGQVTPIHAYTSGDEAELFLNGKSLGRKKKAEGEYRLRWDDVVYQPGEVKVVAYKAGKEWATDTVKTSGDASKLLLTPDRATIAGDGKDLSFVTLTVSDANGQMVPRSMNEIHFEITGPGEIVATDNGDPTDMTAFPSKDRKAFNGMALVIVRAKRGQSGTIVVSAKSDGLRDSQTTVTAK